MNNLPFIKTLLAILNSRKHVIAIAGAAYLTYLVSNALPWLGEARAAIFAVFMLAITGLISVLMGTTAWEDNNKRTNEKVPDNFKDGVTKDELVEYLQNEFMDLVKDLLMNNQEQTQRETVNRVYTDTQSHG